MLDAVTLDQLRTFIAAVEEGSFSAAGRKLRRAQSVVSQTLANLEAQLGVKLFDRASRYPRLTEEGRSLLADARAVADDVDSFKARARSMREGLEPDRVQIAHGEVDGGSSPTVHHVPPIPASTLPYELIWRRPSEPTTWIHFETARKPGGSNSM